VAAGVDDLAHEVVERARPVRGLPDLLVEQDRDEVAALVGELRDVAILPGVLADALTRLVADRREVVVLEDGVQAARGFLVPPMPARKRMRRA
jgi:hypothetical protein